MKSLTNIYQTHLSKNDYFSFKTHLNFWKNKLKN